MATATVDITAQMVQLSDGAFQAFCDDIAGMFGADMRCERRQAGMENLRGLQSHFKKLTAVHLVQGQGTLEGTFSLWFDQGGLFALSGVVVMLQESRVLDQIKRGSIEDAENLQDSAREVGNLLVGSWDRIFREECEGHKHFLKTSTFIGKPWQNPGEVGLSANEEFLFVSYEMTVDPYPGFQCAAVFPKTLLTGVSLPPEASNDGSADEEPTVDQRKENAAKDHPAPTDAGPGPSNKAEPTSPRVERTPEPPGSAGPVPRAVAQTTPAPTQGTPIVAASNAPASKPVGSAAETRVDAKHMEIASVSEVPSGRSAAIADLGNSPAVDASDLARKFETLADDVPMQPLRSVEDRMPRGSGLEFIDPRYIQSEVHSQENALSELLNTPVAQIMEKDVVWANPEDAVQDVIAKMQQHNCGYVLIGDKGAIEGLVSSSNILGAVSLYLRPMFAKWRRPDDDATLGVKVKWIMSRPVRTVRPDTTLAGMIESMRRCGGRCLPVVDERGTVQGIVTAFDIMLHVLQANQQITWKGNPPQAPALLL